MKIQSIAAQETASSIQRVTDKLEQAFLEEMLKHCRPASEGNPFSGGAGEEQFSSFLTREHAEMLSLRLDLGLSQKERSRA